ncbi:MAG: hypothetical protein KatS3mg095_0869 [Candidatus Parcubacteria bacterium]|nr:MAG: hypothetical protein KatS3mg095_0869 [Candidatus Parcubacteria bacterium]
MRVYIGTSGWQYHDWKNKFYPENLPSKDFLKFYSKHFKTVEINTSFYHLTKKSTFEKWYQESNKSFLFSVKLYRLFTHLRKLKLKKEDEKILKTFCENVSALKEKLGPILIQLPPSFKNKEALEKFIKTFKKIFKRELMRILNHEGFRTMNRTPFWFMASRELVRTNISFSSQKSASSLRKSESSLRRSAWNPLIAVEIRNKNLLNQDVYNFFKKEKIIFVISDSPRWPTEIIKTTDTVYVRFHGKPILFASKYSTQELKGYAEKIKTLKPKILFAYFNNDAEGYAVDNALEFKKFFNLL